MSKTENEELRKKLRGRHSFGSQCQDHAKKTKTEANQKVSNSDMNQMWLRAQSLAGLLDKAIL